LKNVVKLCKFALPQPYQLGKITPLKYHPQGPYLCVYDIIHPPQIAHGLQTLTGRNQGTLDVIEQDTIRARSMLATWWK